MQYNDFAYGKPKYIQTKQIEQKDLLTIYRT
jgi:hypothetical protein